MFNERWRVGDVSPLLRLPGKAILQRGLIYQDFDRLIFIDLPKRATTPEGCVVSLPAAITLFHWPRSDFDPLLCVRYVSIVNSLLDPSNGYALFIMIMTMDNGNFLMSGLLLV